MNYEHLKLKMNKVKVFGDNGHLMSLLNENCIIIIIISAKCDVKLNFF